MKIKNHYYQSSKPIRDQYQRGARIGRYDRLKGHRSRSLRLACSLAGREVSFFVLGYRDGFQSASLGVFHAIN